MKQIKTSILLTLSLLFLNGCAGLMKNAEATKLATERANGHHYKQSLEQIEKKLNSQLMTMQMVGSGGMGTMPTNEVKTPLESNLNLRTLRYKGKMRRISETVENFKAYNTLEKSPKKLVFIGKSITRPSDDTYVLYTLTDHGAYRTVQAKTVVKLVVKRKSSSAVSVSVMGIGVNYKDFFDLDESLKKSYTNEEDQYAILRAVDPKMAEDLYLQARDQVEGKNFETQVN